MIQPTRNLAAMKPKGHWGARMNTGKLSEAAILVVGWGTPTHQDSKHGTLSESEQKRDPNVLRNQAHLAGWPSPQAHDTHERGNTMADHHHYPHDLSNAAEMAGWPTPRNEDSEQTGAHRGVPDTLNSAAKLAGWATPLEDDAANVNPKTSRRVEGGAGLAGQTQIALAGWSTPNAPRPHDTEASAGMDFTGQNQNWLGREVLGTKANSFTVATGSSDGSRLNPAFSLWLIAGDSVTPELIRTCPRGLVPSGRQGTRSLFRSPLSSSAR